MPDHFHILAWGPSAEGVKAQVSRILAGLMHSFPEWTGAWQPVEAPHRIPNAKHLLRQVRYVHLNPCRDEWAKDPLEWEWSTHRDWMGAVVRPWPAVEELTEAWHWPKGEVKNRLHQYVSADPSVRVVGTPSPVEPSAAGWGVFRFYEVEWALCAVTRSAVRYARENRVLRNLLVQILVQELQVSTRRIAQELGLGERMVRRIWAKNQAEQTAAAGRVVRRVLADTRMLQGYVPPAASRPPRKRQVRKTDTFDGSTGQK